MPSYRLSRLASTFVFPFIPFPAHRPLILSLLLFILISAAISIQTGGSPINTNYQLARHAVSLSVSPSVRLVDEAGSGGWSGSGSGVDIIGLDVLVVVIMMMERVI
jgi:hypothetical protein